MTINLICICFDLLHAETYKDVRYIEPIGNL